MAMPSLMVNPREAKWARSSWLINLVMSGENLASEAEESAVIGRRRTDGKPQKLFEDPVIDLGFQFGIGVDADHCCKRRHFRSRRG